MKNSSIVLYAALGAAFWLSAVIIINFFGSSVFTENNPRLLLFYFLGIPIFIFITRITSKIHYFQLLKPIVVITLTATLLDGIALTWFRQLYSSSFEVALHGAAWILWGAGLGLLSAFYLDNRKNTAER